MNLRTLPLLLVLAGTAFPAAPQKLQIQSQPTVPVTLDDRRKALNDLFAQYWEDRLSHSPEFASSIGDKRWNDQLTDYSIEAYNQQLSRERDFIGKLGTIDTTGMSDQEILC